MTVLAEMRTLDDMPPAEEVYTRQPTRDDPFEIRSMPHRLREAQRPFLLEQFSEAYDDDKPIKYKSGQHMDELAAITAEVKSEFDAIGNLDPEFLSPFGYRNTNANEIMLPTDQRRQLDDLRLRKRIRLFDAGKKWNLLAEDVQLPPSLLDVPPYRRQGENGSTIERGCLNACFRMVYQAASNIALSELAVDDALWPLVGRDLPNDNVYLKVFRTKAFQNMSGTKITPVTIGGADFTDIANLTLRLKAAKPSIAVYAITMLTSEVKKDVWHANILLAADKDNVVVHDPSNREGGQKYRRLSRLAFHGRWAGAFNKTHLIIVDT